MKHSLSVRDVAALSISDIAPMASLLVVQPAALALAGTGGLLPDLVGAAVAVCVALYLAEVGSMHSVAGGLYSIVGRVLGRALGLMALMVTMT